LKPRDRDELKLAMIEHMPPDRPSALVTACALAAVWGAMEVLAGAGALVMFSGDVAPLHGFGITAWRSEHFTLLAVTQLVAGGLTVVCGIGAWKGWPWARRGTQLTMAFWAVASALFGAAMALTVTGFRGPEPVTTAFFVFWRVSALTGGFMWAAGLAVPVWLLAKPEVNAWFK
jgi:hypothetical protein